MVCAALLATLMALGAVPPAPSAPVAPVLLLVLDVGGDHVAADDRLALTEALSLSLARRLDLEVQSPRNLLDRVGFADQQQQAGCDSSACLAEIANAMGAQYVVFSRVVKLGDRQVLRADVFDNVQGRTVALSALDAGSVGELLRRVPALVDALIEESQGVLPTRITQRRIDVAVERPWSNDARHAAILGSVGAAGTVVFGVVFAASVASAVRLQAAAGAYTSAPSLETARAVLDARGPFSDAALASGYIIGGGLTVASVAAAIVGSVMFVAATTETETETQTETP